MSWRPADGSFSLDASNSLGRVQGPNGTAAITRTLDPRLPRSSAVIALAILLCWGSLSLACSLSGESTHGGALGNTTTQTNQLTNTPGAEDAIAGIASIPTVTQLSEEAQQHLVSAEVHARTGQLGLALAEIDGAIAAAPSHPFAAARRASIAATATSVARERGEAIAEATRTEAAAPQPRGFGARSEEWNRMHRQAPGRTTGAAYDVQPDGTALFALVDHSLGRVLAFQMQPSPGVTVARAKQMVGDQLPDDAIVVFDEVRDTCQMIEYQSATLGRVFSADERIGDPEGYVRVVLFTSYEDLPAGRLDPLNIMNIAFYLGSGTRNRSLRC